MSRRELESVGEGKRDGEGGGEGLRHGNAGRPSNRGQPMKLRRRVLKLIQKKYSGSEQERFGPTLAAEHLAEEDGVVIDHETLRRWMLEAGLWSRQRKRKKHCQRRERKPHFWRTGAVGRQFPRLVRRAWSAGLPDGHGRRCHQRHAGADGERRDDLGGGGSVAGMD